MFTLSKKFTAMSAFALSQSSCDCLAVTLKKDAGSDVTVDGKQLEPSKKNKRPRVTFSDVVNERTFDKDGIIPVKPVGSQCQNDPKPILKKSVSKDDFHGRYMKYLKDVKQWDTDSVVQKEDKIERMARVEVHIKDEKKETGVVTSVNTETEVAETYTVLLDLSDEYGTLRRRYDVNKKDLTLKKKATDMLKLRELKNELVQDLKSAFESLDEERSKTWKCSDICRGEDPFYVQRYSLRSVISKLQKAEKRTGEEAHMVTADEEDMEVKDGMKVYNCFWGGEQGKYNAELQSLKNKTLAEKDSGIKVWCVVMLFGLALYYLFCCQNKNVDADSWQVWVGFVILAVVFFVLLRRVCTDSRTDSGCNWSDCCPRSSR